MISGSGRKQRMKWVLLGLMLTAWMSMGVLSDCDPELANTVLSGVGAATADLAATLIEVAFEAIGPDEPTPVGSAALDTALRWLA